MPRTYIKGQQLPRPGEFAGQQCEGPGCTRRLSSKWLADGCCCTSTDCQEYFNVGKGKKAKAAQAPAAAVATDKAATAEARPLRQDGVLVAVVPCGLAVAAEDAAKAAEAQATAGNKRQRPAKAATKKALPLAPGEALVHNTCVHGDDFADTRDNEMMFLRFDVCVFLDDSKPYCVVNVRLNAPLPCDIEDGRCYPLPDNYSFLVTGTFCDEPEHENDMRKEEATRWMSMDFSIHEDFTLEVARAALAMMCRRGAHAVDVARVRALRWWDDATALTTTLGAMLDRAVAPA